MGHGIEFDVADAEHAGSSFSPNSQCSKSFFINQENIIDKYADFA